MATRIGHIWVGRWSAGCGRVGYTPFLAQSVICHCRQEEPLRLGPRPFAGLKEKSSVTPLHRVVGRYTAIHSLILSIKAEFANITGHKGVPCNKGVQRCTTPRRGQNVLLGSSCLSQTITRKRRRYCLFLPRVLANSLTRLVKLLALGSDRIKWCTFCLPRRPSGSDSQMPPWVWTLPVTVNAITNGVRAGMRLGASHSHTRGSDEPIALGSDDPANIPDPCSSLCPSNRETRAARRNTGKVRGLPQRHTFEV